MRFSRNKLLKWEESEIQVALFISIANRKKIYVDLKYKVFTFMLKTKSNLIFLKNLNYYFAGWNMEYFYFN